MNELSPEELVVEVNKVFKQLPDYIRRLESLGYTVSARMSNATPRAHTVCCDSAAPAIRDGWWLGLAFTKKEVIG